MACAGFRKHLHPRMNTIKAISTVAVLLVSMVVVGWADRPPSSGDYYSIELVHVDAHRGFSSDELMRRAANRSRLRAATMYSQLASAASGPPTPPSIRLPGGVCSAEAEYFMNFRIDGTSDATSAVMDTGSDIIWMTARIEECQKMTKIPCTDHMCESHADCGCDSDKYCQCAIKYGDRIQGMTVEGNMYKGKLKFFGSSSLEPSYASMDIALVCSTTKHFQKCCSTTKHFQKCPSPPPTGLVALGRGDQSLPNQLKVKKFSYCLNKYTNPDLKSILLLNNPAPDLAKGKRKGAAVVTTRLGRHPKKAWYFVQLEAISIGPTRLLIPARHPQKEAADGNMIIDSGSSYTQLQGDAFDKVVEELDRILQGEGKQLDKTLSGDDIYCYSGKPVASMPKMKLHFANSAVMELPWESYFWHYEKGEKSSMCLALRKMGSGEKLDSKTEGNNDYHVLGNFQQQSTHMLFDIENEELKFVQADCSKVV